MKISGFNNISKSLFVSFYRFCYALPGKNGVKHSLAALNADYAALKLSSLMDTISTEIGARILLSSKKDYEPMGASAVALLAEEDKTKNFADNHSQTDNICDYPGYTELCHLDKSHIALHTYPEANEQNGICTFRIDLEVSTCGVVSPIKSLLTGMRFVGPDLVFVDYRQRGFTRDRESGKRLYRDHFLHSIKNVLDAETLENFDVKEDAMPEHRLYLASLKKKNEVCFRAKNRYFLGKNCLKTEQMEKGFELLAKEIEAIEKKK